MPVMNAIMIRRPGGAEELQPVRRPMPEPGPGEVLVSVFCAGVNRADILQRQGKYPPPPGITDIPGLEISGTVVSAGAGVTRWKPGDMVCALLAGGGYADHAVVPESQCLPVPAGLDPEKAAALPEAAFTVWANVFEAGRLKAGESLLVHGGASGIGTMAIQLARAREASVLATAGTVEKCNACEALGAVRGINYRLEDFVSVVQDITAGRGVDVVLDMMAGDYIPRNLEVLAPGGRHITIAAQRGAAVEINILTVMRKRLVLTGSTLRDRPLAEKARLAAEVQAHVWPFVDSGAVRPVVHTVFPMSRAAEAHRLMESGTHTGKIVLKNDFT
ncbi:MAG: NAD(P)H-quinone oxidoreductase [Pseudomonadota bacterium]|nr:NAD(P)H-quinone oxidoreductase [Pseudomonadota bacterium]